ncbi:MAG: type II toxin-antitoxin system VapC family toxin [Bifidobacteriaceae bacterium]|jgi:predicted nucleic acid-binding protein|nr:type II toxin-antitoxin system VapC family toxin [Bifidobacteriaceae bacterium]
MIAVLDAGVAVSIAINDALAPRAHTAVAGYELRAPAIIDLEVASTLARMERAKELSAARAELALSVWLEAAVERVELRRLVVGAFAKRHNVYIADAFYVALAESLNVPLITTDGRLSRAPIPGLTVTLIRRPT